MHIVVTSLLREFSKTDASRLHVRDSTTASLETSNSIPELEVLPRLEYKKGKRHIQ